MFVFRTAKIFIIYQFDNKMPGPGGAGIPGGDSRSGGGGGTAPVQDRRRGAARGARRPRHGRALRRGPLLNEYSYAKENAR